jgi:CRISPR/Cas system-associated exonuclease Cas4 (RecB family)
MDINHISVSRKKVYDECAQKYKYKYHLKVPSPVEEPFYFIYGKMVHKIAEEYVRNRGKRTLGEVANDILSGKIEIERGVKAPKLPPEYNKRLPGHLRSIQSLTEKIGTDGEVEYSFEYDLDPPNKKNIVGFIDRLIFKEEKVFVIDYKTTKKGKYRVNKNTVKTDLQLRAYARIVQKKFDIEAKNIRVALHYLEGGDLIAASYSDKSLDNIEKELLNAYNQIVEHDPEDVRGKVGWYCQRCEYKTLCPFFKSSNSRVVWDGDMSKLGFNS